MKIFNILTASLASASRLQRFYQRFSLLFVTHILELPEKSPMVSQVKSLQKSSLPFWTKLQAELLTRSTIWSEIWWALLKLAHRTPRKSENSDRWRFSFSGFRTPRNSGDTVSTDVTVCQKEVTILQQEDMASHKTRLTKHALILSNATGKFHKKNSCKYQKRKTLRALHVLSFNLLVKLTKMSQCRVRRNEATQNLGWWKRHQMRWRASWVILKSLIWLWTF